jgi:hypothetical protein
VKTRLLVGIALSAILSSAALGAETNYKIINRIKVPDGGFDYATFDTANRPCPDGANRLHDGDRREDRRGFAAQERGARSHRSAVPGTSFLALARREGDVLIETRIPTRSWRT